MSDRIATTPFLRFALLIDAAVSGATGVLMAAGASPLASLLGLPELLILAVGLFFLPYAAALVWLGTRRVVAAGAVWTVIVLNVVWAVDCALLLLSSWVQPTTLGVAFVLIQAAGVLIFAELQFMALRKARGGEPAMA